MNRILLSIPHMGGDEETYIRQAFASNWLSTVGPNISAFKREFECHIGLPAVGGAALRSMKTSFIQRARTSSSG